MPALEIYNNNNTVGLERSWLDKLFDSRDARVKKRNYFPDSVYYYASNDKLSSE